MLDRLTKLREERANSDKGFTLIELLVVVVIIGILIAIAIPLYLNYTNSAKEKSAESDVRNAISRLEQCNSDNNSYPTAANATTGVLTGCGNATPAPTLVISSGDTLSYFPSSASAPTGYLVQAKAADGKYFCYTTGAGGSVKNITTAHAGYATTC